MFVISPGALFLRFEQGIVCYSFWTESACYVVCLEMAMGVGCVTFRDSALSCCRNLLSCIVLKVEQTALPILCAFAIGFFYFSEKGNVGHDLQYSEKFVYVSFFKFVDASFEFFQSDIVQLLSLNCLLPALPYIIRKTRRIN